MTTTISRSGTPPPPVQFAGPWDVSSGYLPGHVVQAGTSLYQATAATTGNDPATDDGTHWVRVYEGT